jgi:drug/metabolite transporter (DMT)-like permease
MIAPVVHDSPFKRDESVCDDRHRRWKRTATRVSSWVIVVGCVWQQHTRSIPIAPSAQAFVLPLQSRVRGNCSPSTSPTTRASPNDQCSQQRRQPFNTKMTRRRSTRLNQAADVYTYPSSSSSGTTNTTDGFLGFDDGACIEGHDLASLLQQFVALHAVSEVLSELNTINDNPSSMMIPTSSSSSATTSGVANPETSTSKTLSMELDTEFENQDKTSSIMRLLPGRRRMRCIGATATAIGDDDDISVVSIAPSKPVAPPTEADLDATWRARGLLLAAAALYGTNFSLVKLLGDVMPVGISTPLRFGMAALATLPWLVGRDDSIVGGNGSIEKANARRAAMLGFEVGLWNSVGYVAQAVGLETTLASKSAFICSMAVVVVPLLDSLTGKRLLPRQWVGAAMALVGVAFLELGGDDGITAAISSFSEGDALSFVQPVMFGIGFWRMEKAMHQYPDQAPRMTAAQLLAVFIASMAYCLWWAAGVDGSIGGDDSVQTITSTILSYPWQQWLTDPSILFALFWTGCISTALTIYMENMALETLSAAETTLIFSTEPLWGTAFAAAVMGEQLGMNAGFGAFFILSACLYSNLGVQGFQKMLSSVVVARNRSNQQDLDSFSKQQQEQHSPSKKSSSITTSSFWTSLRNKKGWPWLPSGLTGTIATWNVASDINAQDINEIVDELMENLVDKLS